MPFSEALAFDMYNTLASRPAMIVGTLIELADALQ